MTFEPALPSRHDHIKKWWKQKYTYKYKNKTKNLAYTVYVA